jgi:predicted transcriptional regulator
MDIFTFTKEYVDSIKYKDLDNLAQLSGVPVHTINKIKSGETKNPGVLTVQKLYKAIQESAVKDSPKQ